MQWLLILSLVVYCSGHGYQQWPEARSGTADAPGTSECAASGQTEFNTPEPVTWCFDPDLEYDLTWQINADHDGTVEYKMLQVSGTSYSELFDVTSSPVPNGNTGQNTFSHTFGRKCTDDCVLQWHWTAPNDGQYFGCADVRVGGKAAYGKVTVVNYSQNTFVSDVANYLGLDTRMIRVDQVQSGAGPNSLVYFYIENGPTCDGASASLSQLKEATNLDFTNLVIDGRFVAIDESDGDEYINMDAIWGLIAMAAVVVVVGVPLVIIAVVALVFLFEAPKTVDYGVHFTKETIEQMQQGE